MIIFKGNAQSYFSCNGIKGTSEITAVSVPAKLNASGYATYASTYALDFSDDTEFSAWQITAIDGSTITFNQITSAVAAGTGVLLKGTASKTVSIPVAASGSDISASNLLHGTTAPQFVEAGAVYGLSGSSFVPSNADGVIPAGKAYINAGDIPAEAKAFTFVFVDEATGINGLTPDPSLSTRGEIYNLGGQRMSKLQRGINIVNGKKVLVK